LIDTSFLETLPKNEFRSGMAEMLKHGLISGEAYWNKLLADNAFTGENLDQLIYESVLIKHDIVLEDPTEKGLRKTLNFGHTLGHAIESYFLSNEDKKPLLHGEAIAIGMILECHLSSAQLSFSDKSLEEVTHTIIQLYDAVPLEIADYNSILDLLKFDKKNEHGNINFVLLESIGNAKINCQVDNQLILEAFDYYNKNLPEN